MKSRLFRALVCLLVICCLIINISPIKAKAVDPVTISAAAILGVTVIALSAYCGFVLAPPDVDFIEDVGEEFNDFVQVVVSTGGFPGSDDDDEVDDLVDTLTNEIFDTMGLYTDSVSNALSKSTTIVDPAIFGGFIGLMPAFKLFLKWMIQNGYLDREVQVPHSLGFYLYGDYYLPKFPDIEDHPYQVLVKAGTNYYMNYSDTIFYYDSSSGKCVCPTSYSHYDVGLPQYKLDSWNVTSTLGDPSHHFRNTLTGVTGTNDVILWSNFDILSYQDGTTVCFVGSEPSSTSKESERIEPLHILGPISGSIVSGMEAAGIPLPEKFNYVKLFDGFSDRGLSAVYDNINQIAQYLKDGSLPLEDYQESITYEESEVSEETEPSDPTTDPDTTTPSEDIIIDGTLGGAPVGDFLSKLGDLIMSPFRWIWNQIQSFFDPWITSIGNWFSNVRADIQSLPGKFENWFTNIIDGITSLPQSFSQWFKDLIDGVKAIPQKILDGIDARFPSIEDNRGINDFKLDLTGFFPFCIPFDIYEFLTLLAADPVAPVFTWEIAVPQLGQTFEIEIDLTPWDEVAALFRKLELLAFIVGLAYVTREKYIRG